MVIAYCKQQKFINFLLDNDCKIISNKYWEDHNVVVFEKDGESFPLLLEDVYYYFTVNKICQNIGIAIPKFDNALYNVSTPIEDEEE